ncbi:MAG TPA: hypothetical protein VFA52_00025 [Candidatus Paceibacterota bacterium]|jgi:hypothetical protein|nr:hypothetical protein [Candidatus Paceibacterota bacterium]
MSQSEQLQLIFGFAGISTASLAFIVGLYAFFDSHSRLQESAYNIVTTIFLFSLSTLLIVVSLIITANDVISVGLDFAEIGLITFAIGWLLLFRTFFLLYGRVSHMRDRRFLKYVFPFSIINNLRSKKYALTVRPRSSFSLEPYSLTSEEIKIISQGYSFLFVGPRYLTFQLMAIDILTDGVNNGETANYVCCDRPPYQVWGWFKRGNSLSANLFRHIILIDAFSPHLGYDDEVLKDANEEVEREGVTIILGKGMAGVHSAGNTAWYKTKNILKKEGLKYRIPNRIVYDNLSSLASVSSCSLVRSFYQHCIASERKYGMITIFIEFDDTDPEILSAIESVVDAILIFSLDEKTREVQVEAKKLSAIDLAKHAGRRVWKSKRYL